MWMRDVITITEPLLFIAENVKGLTNLEDVKEIIEQDFSNAANGGYLVVPARVLHAADYGVPQSRERVIFFGFKKSALTADAKEALSASVIPAEYDPYPPATHAYNVNGDNLYKPVTCKEAFSGLLEPDATLDLSQKKYSRAKYMGKHCQGHTEVILDDIGPTIRSEHHGNIEYTFLQIIIGAEDTENFAEYMLEHEAELTPIIEKYRNKTAKARYLDFNQGVDGRKIKQYLHPKRCSRQKKSKLHRKLYSKICIRYRRSKGFRFLRFYCTRKVYGGALYQLRNSVYVFIRPVS